MALRPRSRFTALSSKDRTAVRDQAIAVVKAQGMDRDPVLEGRRQKAENQRTNNDHVLRAGGKPPAPNTPPNRMLQALRGNVPGRQRVTPQTLAQQRVVRASGAKVSRKGWGGWQ
jgi:hypothetical protein